MSTRIIAARGVVSALALVLLAGCGGGDDGSADPVGSSASPSPSATSSEPAPVSDEQALRQLVRDYEQAFERVFRTRAADGTLDGVATSRFAEQVLGFYQDEIYGEGMEIFGSFKIEIESVQVDGDRAEVVACSDGGAVYIVEQGEEIPEGATGQLRVPQTYQATRDESGWLIDSATSGRREC